MEKSLSVILFQNNQFKDFFITKEKNDFTKFDGYLINGKYIKDLDIKYLNTS